MSERKGTFKVEILKQIEEGVQQKWDELKVFEEDAPATGAGSSDEKYFVTFPYPDILGHIWNGAVPYSWASLRSVELEMIF